MYRPFSISVRKRWSAAMHLHRVRGTNILDGTGGTAVMNSEVRKTTARRKSRVQLETFQTQAATPDS